MTFEAQLEALLARWREELNIERQVAAEIGSIMSELASARQRTSDRLIRLAAILQAPHTPSYQPEPPFSADDLAQVLEALRHQQH